MFTLYFKPAEHTDWPMAYHLKCQLYDYRRELHDRLDTLAMQYYNMLAHQVNDDMGHYTTGHQDVLRLLRVAAGDLSHDNAWKEISHSSTRLNASSLK